MNVSVGDSLVVDHDLYCARCEYNLRMQPFAGACPECGAPVSDAFKHQALMSQRRTRWMQLGLWLLILSYIHSLAIRAWVTVAQANGNYSFEVLEGITVAAGAIAALILVRCIPYFLIRALLTALWVLMGLAYVIEHRWIQPYGWYQFGWLITSLMQVIAFWLITVRLAGEPRRFAPWARGLIFCSLVQPLGQSVAMINRNWGTPAGQACMLGMGLASLAATFLLLRHLICMARQLQANALASHGRFLACGFLIISAAMQVTGIAARIHGPIASTTYPTQWQMNSHWFWLCGNNAMALWIIGYALVYALYLRRREKPAILPAQPSP